METLQTLSKTGHKPCEIYKPDVLSRIDEMYAQPEDGLAVSEKEYWEKYYIHPRFNYEWNNGYLEVKPMTGYDGMKLYRWFLKILDNFIETFPVAEIMGLETAFDLTIGYKKTIRKPDLALILNTNPLSFVSGDLSYSGTCDICFEFLSYSSKREIERDTVYKKIEYEIAGVKEYYILDDRGLETAFYKLGRSGKYEKLRPIKGDIIRSGVVPGFQFRISDLYRQPSLIELTEDKVYNSYVMLDYQAEKQRAEQERMRAEQERVRADHNASLLQKAEQEKQILTEKLRKLGISPSDLMPGS